MKSVLLDGTEEQIREEEQGEEEQDTTNDDELAPLPEEENHDADALPAVKSAVPDNDNDGDGDDDGEEVESLRGVLFGRSVRASYASLNIAVLDDDDDDDQKESEVYHVLVRLQFLDNLKELRSHFRRHCKFGDLLKLRGGLWHDVDDAVDTEWREPRLIINVRSVEQARTAVQLERVRFWSMSKTQEWQNRYYRLQQQRKARDSEQKQQQQQQQQQQQKNNSDSSTKKNPSDAHHAGGLAKRKQGEYVANFLMNMICHKQQQQNKSSADDTPEEDVSAWATRELLDLEQKRAVLGYLNTGTGVLDVAGGSGHVSMALGLKSIQSTVVDPRENAGKLPGRDRKVWNRALKTTHQKKRKLNTATPVNNDKTDRGGLKMDNNDDNISLSNPASVVMADLVSSTDNTSSSPHPQNNYSDVMADIRSAIHALPGTNSIREDTAIRALPERAASPDPDGATIHALPNNRRSTHGGGEPMSSIQQLPSSDTTSCPPARSQERPQEQAAQVPDTIQIPSTVSLSATASEQSNRSNSTNTTNAGSDNNNNSSSSNNNNNNLYCQPVRPYQTRRAWFGLPPEGVDNTFRNPDDANVPVCDAQHPLLKDCRAIVALHPDEATDAIVDTAVQLRVPFVIVPCCVFCRLFPHRKMPVSSTRGTGKEGEQPSMVSTYNDLLDYLQAKDPSIQRATLPFVGANTVLWSTFT